MLRILMIVAAPPFPPTDGGKARAYNLARAMAAADGYVDMLCLHEQSEKEEHLRHLSALGIHVHPVHVARRSLGSAVRLARATLSGDCVSAALFRFPQVRAKLTHLLGQELYHVVQIDQTYLADLFAFVPNSRGARRLPLKALSLYDVEAVRFPRLVSMSSRLTARGLALRLDSNRIRRWERDRVREADVCIAVSHKDEAYLQREYGVQEVCVIPNGVDSRGFAPRCENVRRAGEFLFVGGLNYPPNLDAATWLARDILPKIRMFVPNVSCTLIGPGALKHQRMIARAGPRVLGLVPDVRQYLHRATALLVPLRAGGGTRVKILEALAAGLPVISTHIGAEGLELRHEENVLYADQPEDFAAAAQRLCSQPSLWEKLSKNGMLFAREGYDWQDLGSRLLAHYKALVEQLTP